MGARLTERPGTSTYVGLGRGLLERGEDRAPRGGPGLIERHGAVSPEVAAALADGAMSRFGADIGVGITGIAGPDGGTEEKPVGYVCWCVKAADGREMARDVRLPGDRAEIRDRATTRSRCTCCAACCAARSAGLSKERPGSPRARLFVALDLPPRCASGWASGATN